MELIFREFKKLLFVAYTWGINKFSPTKLNWLVNSGKEGIKVGKILPQN